MTICSHLFSWKFPVWVGWSFTFWLVRGDIISFENCVKFCFDFL